MNSLLRRRAGYRSYMCCLLTLLSAGMSATAQQRGDTIVVSPTQAPDTVAFRTDTGTINSRMVKSLLDSLSITINQNQDTGATSVADSESFSPATAKPDSVVFRSVPDSVVSRWQRIKDFAYANDPSYWTTRPDDNKRYKPNPLLNWLFTVLFSRWFRYFLYAVLIAALAYTLFRIIRDNDMQPFFRSNGKRTAAPGEEASPLEEDLDAQLKGAMDAGDYRLAVRYLYLKALRLLNDRERIRYHIQATNQEYVRQLGGSSLGGPFRFLTSAYDRIWYGEFALTEGQFGRLHDHFRDFYKSIHGS